jgi:hypothetical protein
LVTPVFVDFVKAIRLLLAIAPGFAQANFPANQYICHAVSAYAGPGLVWIQSDSLEEAQTVAVDAEIVTLNLTYSKASDVVQCVLSSESLSDLSMETFRKRVPR